jgi:hypothetical protein
VSAQPAPCCATGTQLCDAASHLPSLLSASSLLRCSGATRRLAAAAIRPSGYAALSNEESGRQPCSYPTGRKARRAWPRLAWWLIDISIVNAFKLWSIDKDAPKQLNFREELMHTLVKLFGSNREVVQVSRGANAGVALVKDHYPQHTEKRGYCTFCSHGSVERTQTRIICAKCGVHLCIGNCFKRYHV